MGTTKCSGLAPYGTLSKALCAPPGGELSYLECYIVGGSQGIPPRGGPGVPRIQRYPAETKAARREGTALLAIVTCSGGRRWRRTNAGCYTSSLRSLRAGNTLLGARELATPRTDTTMAMHEPHKAMSSMLLCSHPYARSNSRPALAEDDEIRNTIGSGRVCNTRTTRRLNHRSYILGLPQHGRS